LFIQNTVENQATKKTMKEEPINPMDQERPYDLEERTYEFALGVRLFLKQRNWHQVNWSDVNQLLRSSGSVAANYIESQEALGGDDFIYRIRLCRKETRESSLWLRLLEDTTDLSDDQTSTLHALLSETKELSRIFTPIIKKREARRERAK
jgi:four helix bundle protein